MCRKIIIFFTVRTSPPRPTPKLSATAYSIHPQLPSVSGGRSSIRHQRTSHAVVTGTHLSRKRIYIMAKNVVNLTHVLDTRKRNVPKKTSETLNRFLQRPLEHSLGEQHKKKISANALMVLLLIQYIYQFRP